MPDDRLERTRRAYDTAPAWRRPSENAADRLEPAITMPCVFHVWSYDLMTDEYVCQHCHARTDWL